MKIASSIKYALLGACLVIATKLTVFLTHSQFTTLGRYSGVFALAFLSIPLVLAIINRRDTELKGFIALKEVMRTGLFVCVIASMIVALFNYIYFRFIDHEILAYWLVESERSLRELKGSEEEIKKAQDYLTDFYSPSSQAMGSLTGVLGVGAVLAFILSAFLVKNPPSAEN
ncbi:MAG: DUF4199 domain-containing protein [Bacteroidetes bacterium]|nr:DUF4199 domain-containing protein [Bacteroidota bacterium]